MYSLGYKCIYISGYNVNKINIYNENDFHSWSLIKIDEKNNWLPFDPTCGIFTGKLPITHVFESYFFKKTNKEGTDNIIMREKKVHGKLLMD